MPLERFRGRSELELGVGVGQSDWQVGQDLKIVSFCRGVRCEIALAWEALISFGKEGTT